MNVFRCSDLNLNVTNVKGSKKKTILMERPISITIWQSELIILPLEKNQYKKQIKTKSKVLSVEIILTQNNIQLIPASRSYFGIPKQGR
jgi:hypothetical protein